MINRFVLGILTIFAAMVVMAQDAHSLDDKLDTNIVSTVEDLVEYAKQGGKVEIAAGNYILDEPLSLSNDVKLIGAGRGQTFIISTAERFGVGFESDGNFKAQGITFEHKGNLTAHVVWIHDGKIDINNCAFVGGIKEEEAIGTQLITVGFQTLRGSGLLLSGNVMGTVKNSVAEGNGLHGIQVIGISQPRLEQNTLKNNTQDGIAYLGNAGGIAIDNISEDNGLHGIDVQGRAQPRLEQNTLINNIESGIAYFHNTRGVAVSNTIEGNGLHGINIQDSARPRLKQNTLRNNDNDGISVKDEAQPKLEQNIVQNNARIGIAYFENAGGMATSNTSEGNGSYGISVSGEVKPKLEQNIV